MSDHDQSGAHGSNEEAQDEPVLSDEDKALRVWFSSLVLQDARYNDKVILKLAALAVHSDEFRDRLINDTRTVLDNLGYSPPEGVELKVYDNTEHTLHVVLPSRLEQRSPELRELLRSRTSVATFEAVDDWDFGDIRIPEDSDHGDPNYDSGHPADDYTTKTA